mgnify:CR=1 FL=1
MSCHELFTSNCCGWPRRPFVNQAAVNFLIIHASLPTQQHPVALGYCSRKRIKLHIIDDRSKNHAEGCKNRQGMVWLTAAAKLASSPDTCRALALLQREASSWLQPRQTIPFKCRQLNILDQVWKPMAMERASGSEESLSAAPTEARARISGYVEFHVDKLWVLVSPLGNKFVDGSLSILTC